MADFQSDAQRVRGQVKWFDPAKGFGFVIDDQTGSDILLHINVLRNFGQSSVAEGSRVEILTNRTERGIQAVEVLEINPPEPSTELPLSDFAQVDMEEVRNSPLEPARVKWFDKSKGFGFANIFGDSEDIFLHIEILRRSGLSDLQPGEALAIRVIDGRRGRMAAEVHAWEAAVEQSA